MRLTVKPHQAFFAIRHQQRGPSTPPASCRCASPQPPRLSSAFFGRRRAASPRTLPHSPGRLAWLRSGLTPELPSIRVGPATVPSTYYRIRPWRPARRRQEPTHRTNGAFTGSPGGTTAALTDLTYLPRLRRRRPLSPLRIACDLIRLHASRHPGRPSVPPRRRVDPQTPILLQRPLRQFATLQVTP
jgi:hypothetical protein